MLENLLNGNNVNVLIALLAGISTFFASCLVPLVPTYLAYLSGVSLNATEKELEQNKRTIFTTALFFVLGFILTFIILSLILTQFSIWLNPIRSSIEKAAGLLFVLMGLYMVGVFKSSFFGTEHKINTDSFFFKYKRLHAFITGTAFGFSWSPCIGPVLAVILYWTAREASFAQGFLNLAAFGIGLGIPFLLVATGFEKFMPFVKKYQRFSFVLNLVAGTIIVAVGILMLTGQFQNFSGQVLRYVNLHTSTF